MAASANPNPANRPRRRRGPIVSDPSLKERESVLFEDPHALEVQATEVAEWKPFRVYLRETPAAAFPQTTKALLIVAGIVVTLLFGATVWRVLLPRVSKPPTRSAISETHPHPAIAFIAPL